jgi:hypothetical protein
MQIGMLRMTSVVCKLLLINRTNQHFQNIAAEQYMLFTLFCVKGAFYKQSRWFRGPLFSRVSHYLFLVKYSYTPHAYNVGSYVPLIDVSGHRLNHETVVAFALFISTQ